MRNCRDITALVSLGLDKKLSLRERLAISLHVLMCTRCRNFQTQSQFIRKTAHRYAEQLQDRLGKKP
jgi:hypothetical protein